MTWDALLWKNYTDGLVGLHKGRVVYERYFGALTENRVHAVMSLTKSFTGVLASMLVAEGTLDEHKNVSAYVPELSPSAFGDATVRQVMDMTAGLQYSEDCANPPAEVWDFSAVGNPVPRLGDTKAPMGCYQVDGLRTPFAGGGFNAGLRDWARFGKLIRNNGKWNGQQIIPAQAVEDIETGGSTDAFATSDHLHRPRCRSRDRTIGVASRRREQRQ